MITEIIIVLISGFNLPDSLRQQLEGQLSALSQPLNELQRFKQSTINPYNYQQVLPTPQ